MIHSLLTSTSASHLPFLFLHVRERVELTFGVCRVQELRKQFQVISELRSEIKNLQADNLKLYEKVRYMQSYREEAGSRPPTSQLDPLPAPAGSGTGLDDMGKYRARYEEAMNPFEAFRGRVRCHAAYRGIFHAAEFYLCPGSDASVSEPQSNRKRCPRVNPRYPWEQTSKDFLYMLCNRPAPASYVHDLRMHDFLRHTPAETSQSIWFIEA